MKLLNKEINSCCDCPCESMTKGIDARIFCNFENKDNPRSVLVMSTIDKARDILICGCKLTNINRCCRCLGSGKVYNPTADADIQCDMCYGVGTV